MAARRRAPRTRSLASAAGFEAFVLDQLGETGDVSAKKMFGGVGLYCDGVFFGIVARDELYLKVDDSTRAQFEKAGSAAFKPYPDRPGTMQYYRVPIDVLESAPELVRWAREAVAVARRKLEP
jgi:DNA transformation protein and related proteins